VRWPKGRAWGRGRGSTWGILEISHAKTSRQLALLRAQRLVQERQEGRHVYYRLMDPAIAAWVAEGLTFIHSAHSASDDIREAAEKSRAAWLEPQP
jgi:DNA-binding transcriptional ArsR family regulator